VKLHAFLTSTLDGDCFTLRHLYLSRNYEVPRVLNLDTRRRRMVSRSVNFTHQ